jgi:5-epi-alpha-selinene synthase
MNYALETTNGVTQKSTREMVRRADIPELYCPIPSMANPHASEAEKHSLEWAQRFRLVHQEEYQAAQAAKSAWFGAYPMPDASPEDLFLAADWAMWLFVYDDLVDGPNTNKEQMVATLHRLTSILKGEAATEQDHPVAHALYNFCTRLKTRCDKWWYDRFVSDVERQFHGYLWERAFQSNEQTPDLSTYIRLRPYTYVPCVTLACIARDIKPNAAFLQHGTIIAMTSMALNQICWVNDVLGVNREIEEGSPQNLALVIMKEFNLPLKDALRRAAHMTNAEMKAFLKLEESLPDFGDEDNDAKSYVNVLRRWIRGHLDWYRETARYPF